MGSRQHPCASVGWPLPPMPATAATARRWGRGVCGRVTKGPVHHQARQLALAFGEGLSGPR